MAALRSADSLTATVLPIKGNETENHLIHLDEVIFLRIWIGFKREISCTDLRVCLLTTSVAWFLSTLILLLSGIGGYCRALEIPWLIPGSIVWLILWSLHYLLCGIALGLIAGSCNCHKKMIGQGMVLWAFYLLTSLFWAPVFYTAGLEITGLLLIAGAIFLGVAVLFSFARWSILAALLMLCCIGWQIYSFLQSLLIILWN